METGSDKPLVDPFKFFILAQSVGALSIKLKIEPPITPQQKTEQWNEVRDQFHFVFQQAREIIPDGLDNTHADRYKNYIWQRIENLHSLWTTCKDSDNMPITQIKMSKRAYRAGLCLQQMIEGIGIGMKFQKGFDN